MRSRTEIRLHAGRVKGKPICVAQNRSFVVAPVSHKTKWPYYSEDTVLTCQAVCLPPCIVWIKLLIFFHHGPRDMQQFPGGGTAGHFLWLADLTQTGVEGFDNRVMLRCTQRRHVKGCP